MATIQIMSDYGDVNGRWLAFYEDDELNEIFKFVGDTEEDMVQNVQLFAQYLENYADQPQLLIENFGVVFEQPEHAIDNLEQFFDNWFTLAEEFLLDGAEGAEPVTVWASEDGETMLSVIEEVGTELLAAL